MKIALGIILLGALVVLLLGCGTAVYKHTIEVVVNDPTRRLGPPPIDVSVFDKQMGYSSDWARKFMGPTSDDAPYTVPFSSQKTVTILDPPRPNELSLGFALPAYESRGYFWLLMNPGSKASGELRAAFIPYGEYFPPQQTTTMTVQYTAKPEPKGWHVMLRLLVPPGEREGRASPDSAPR
jgi:hypothetical protein